MHHRAIIIAVFIVLTFFSVCDSSRQGQYKTWKGSNGYNWSGKTDSYRYMVYTSNVNKIKKHNKDKRQTFQMGQNKFTGLTKKEFQAFALNNKIKTDLPPAARLLEEENIAYHSVQRLLQTTTIDWKKLGKVSPVKDQGYCGSCWAFSAVGVLESFNLIKVNKNISLSQQQLVDCTRATNYGCDGGWNYKALNYVKTNGITYSSSYPYKAVDQTCKTKTGAFKISTVTTVIGCTKIKAALMKQPIGVSVDASNWGSYRVGVFNSCSTSLNHNVLLVGVTSTYYFVKNSWGTRWGESGYIKLSLTRNCGLCNDYSPYVS